MVKQSFLGPEGVISHTTNHAAPGAWVLLCAEEIFEKVRPRWWYAVIVDCSNHPRLSAVNWSLLRPLLMPWLHDPTICVSATSIDEHQCQRCHLTVSEYQRCQGIIHCTSVSRFAWSTQDQLTTPSHAQIISA